MTEFELPILDASTLGWDRLVGRMNLMLRTTGVGVVRNFWPRTAAYMSFMSRFGTPLEYYGDDAGTHPEHRAIWRVRYDERAWSRGEVHAADGPLAVHSSQSLLDPRPRFFCMLMVDNGWQDQADGSNGESLIVSWAEALRVLRSNHPAEFEDMRALLLDGVEFPDGTTRPLAYELGKPMNDDDLGVRLNSKQLEHLQHSDPGSPAAVAVERLCAAAQAAAHRIRLRSRDLIIVDNDRWGHGRESVVGQRVGADGSVECNPRELWSATVA